MRETNMAKLRLHVRNTLLFLRCLVSIFRFGMRNRILSEPKKVVVFMLAKLGDMVCVTPLFHTLKRHIPGVKVYVVGNAINRELLECNNDVDEYIVFDEERIGDVAKRLAKENIDVALLRGPGFVGMATALLARIPAVIAPEVSDGRALSTRTYAMLLPYVITVEYVFGKYMPRQLLRLLEPMGIFSDDTKKHLGFSHSADTMTDRFFTEHGIDARKDFIVGISPSAGNKIKEWPPERFAEVADYLIDKRRAKVVLVGGPSDISLVERVIEHMKYSRAVINSQGVFSVDELKAFISKLSLFISVDTGPIYIAEAFNVPTVDIVGPMDENEQPPRGPLHRVVAPSDRKEPQISVLNARVYDKKEAMRQTLATSVLKVVSETDCLIDQIHVERNS